MDVFVCKLTRSPVRCRLGWPRFRYSSDIRDQVVVRYCDPEKRKADDFRIRIVELSLMVASVMPLWGEWVF